MTLTEIQTFSETTTSVVPELTSVTSTAFETAFTTVTDATVTIPTATVTVTTLVSVLTRLREVYDDSDKFALETDAFPIWNPGCCNSDADGQKDFNR